MFAIRGKVLIKSCDLNLKLMLEGGQSFRWQSIKDKNEWIGVFKGIFWHLTQSDDSLSFIAHTSASKQLNRERSSKKSETVLYERLLSDYLRLESPLDEYYTTWSESDSNFKQAALTFHGLRILDQDPIENLFSFICSSNNNIARISGMVEKMCSMYGEEICTVEGKTYHDFPTVNSLTQPSVEQALRSAGFGYRAKFISATAHQLSKLGGAKYLNKLKTLPYNEAKQQLLQFPGIGPKVADCICLMSLGQFEAVPVDTHVFQVASQTYLPHLKSVKSVTDRVYNEIGDHFRQLYGPLAGWAHTILFCADLKKFRTSDTQQIESTRKKASKRKIISKCETKGKRKSVDCNDGVHEKFDENIITKPSVEVVKGEVPVSFKDLHLRVTFNCGQTYRWRQIGEGLWRGVHADRVWTLTQAQDSVRFTCHYSPMCLRSSPLYNNSHTKSKQTEEEKCESLLRDYFRLDECLGKMYTDWSERDKRFRDVSAQVYGLRMTKQDAVENLFAFICSSNNTISRITGMVAHLSRVYGDKICILDGEEYFSAPRLERLCLDGVTEELKTAGFGFRSRYIEEAAKAIQRAGGATWLHSLLTADYTHAKHMLTKLPGIGAKVADCICLTALDHLDAIPVDTHVFQIAKKYYLPHLRSVKTVSRKSYEEIGAHFRQLFGHYAGWAHTVLFCSELRSSADLLES